MAKKKYYCTRSVTKHQNLYVDGKFILLLIIYLSLLTDKKNKQKKNTIDDNVGSMTIASQIHCFFLSEVSYIAF